MVFPSELNKTKAKDHARTFCSCLPSGLHHQPFPATPLYNGNCPSRARVFAALPQQTVQIFFFFIFGDDMISPHTYTRVRVHAQTGEDYTQGDSDVILMPTGFRRHCIGKTLIDVFHCDIDDIPLLASW